MASYNATFTGGGLAKAQADFDAYFKTAKPGDITPWFGGYLTMGTDGQATWTAPEGQESYGLKIRPGMKIAEFTGNPYLRKMVSQTYGIDERDIGKSTWNKWYGTDANKNKTFTPTGGYTADNFLIAPHTIDEYNNPTYQSGLMAPKPDTTTVPKPDTTVDPKTNPTYYEQSTGTGNIGTSTMQSDYQNYFKTATPGTAMPYAGGTLTLAADRQSAVYSTPDGQRLIMTPTTPLSELAKYPGIKASWDVTYPGWNGTTAQGTGGTNPITSNHTLTSPAFTKTPTYPDITGDQAVAKGLGQAYGMMSNYIPSQYPDYVPSQTTSPSQGAYINYTPNAPMATQAIPQYKGLMGSDYDALQTALTTPGQIAAQNAYNTADTNLKNTMGGRGLYGSSIMANQANQGLNREYMNALATNAANAAAQRYNLQSTNLQNENTFGLNAANLGMQQNQNLYTAGVSDAARLQDYNLGNLNYTNAGQKAQTDWANQQALEQFQYKLASGQYNNAQQEAMMNQYLALAGLGAPLSTANQQYNAQQQAASDAAQASLYGGLLGGLTTLGSAMLLK